MNLTTIFQPGAPARFQTRVIATSVFALSLSAGCASGTYDIRPQSVIDGVSDDEEQKARALLDRAAANAGGRELLTKHAGFRAEMTDVWTSTLGKLFFLRYEPVQKIVVESTGPRVDNVTMTLVDGERAGEVWGIEGTSMYIKKVNGVREPTDDFAVLLYIKNPASLVLAPLRLSYADRVAYLGRVEEGGRTYDKVFATWETFDPNDQFDQWILWIDADTGNIAKVHVTVREIDSLLVKEGVVELGDYKQVGDVLIPTTISAVLDYQDPDPDPLRTWTVTKFEWTDAPDAVSGGALEAGVRDGAGPASMPASVGQEPPE